MSAVIEVKTIKIKRLKIDAMRLELLNALRAEGTAIKREYQKTTATWRNKPDFAEAISLAGGDATVLVAPDGPHAKQFGYVDKGTRPHIIRSRRAKVLRFGSSYTAKTTPGVIGSSGGGSSGQAFSRLVHHPGTEARRFSEIIQERRKKPFRQAMIKAMQRGAEKMNGN